MWKLSIRPHAPASPTVALAVGVLASGAANAQWAYDHGGDHVSYAAGAFATLLAPTAIHLWPRVPLAGELHLPYWKGRHLTLPVWRLIRAQVMTLICAAAAFVNLTHAVEVLTHRGWAWLTAGGLILAVETIVVMASLARRQPEARQTKRAGGGRKVAVAAPAGKNEGESAKSGSGAALGTLPSSPPPARPIYDNTPLGPKPYGHTPVALLTPEQRKERNEWEAKKKRLDRRAKAHTNGVAA